MQLLGADENSSDSKLSRKALVQKLHQHRATMSWMNVHPRERRLDVGQSLYGPWVVVVGGPHVQTVRNDHEEMKTSLQS